MRSGCLSVAPQRDSAQALFDFTLCAGREFECSFGARVPLRRRQERRLLTYSSFLGLRLMLLTAKLLHGRLSFRFGTGP